MLATAALWVRSLYVCDTLERRWNTTWQATASMAAPPAPGEFAVNAGWYAYSTRGHLVVGLFNWQTVVIPPPASSAPAATHWEWAPSGPLVPVELLRSLQTKFPDWVQAMNAGTPTATNWQKGYNRIIAIPYWSIVAPLFLLLLLPIPAWQRRRIRRPLAASLIAQPAVPAA